MSELKDSNKNIETKENDVNPFQPIIDNIDKFNVYTLEEYKALGLSTGWHYIDEDEINKLKVNDYVRCGSAGIKQAKEIIKDENTSDVVAFIDEKGLKVGVKYIQDFNSDPVKLIELGDLINNEIVSEEYFFDGVLYRSSRTAYEKLVKVKKSDLVSFVTKEQLKSDEFIFDWNKSNKEI